MQEEKKDMNAKQAVTNIIPMVLLSGLIFAAGCSCSGGPLTTREKGAGVD
jgi:hypothetical protein